MPPSQQLGTLMMTKRWMMMTKLCQCNDDDDDEDDSNIDDDDDQEMDDDDKIVGLTQFQQSLCSD